MTTSKIAWVVAAALFAAMVLPTVSVASNHGGGGGISRVAHCKHYRDRAWSTGEEYWWARYRQCLSGWD